MICNIVMLVGPGRYRLTRQALDSLRDHTDPATYNLTLVCDEPDFRIQNVARNANLNITALEVNNSGHTLSQLKNLGVAWSEQRWGRGDWLYISDSDVWFGEGWLTRLKWMAELAEKENFKLFGGQIHPFHNFLPRKDGGTIYQGATPILQNDGICSVNVYSEWTEHSILDGPSWLMRWQTWDRHGPLDRTTAPGVCQSEEYSFCDRLRSGNLHTAGRIGVISPHVVVHTGLTHLDGHDCVGRKERELMIPKGVLAE